MTDFSSARTTTSCFDANAAVLQGGPGKISLAHPEKDTSGRQVGRSDLVQGWFVRLAAEDYAGLHDKGDTFEHVDVFQWVAGNGDYVGVVAGLQNADLMLPVE
jgi:hypothetical protein